MPDYEWKVNPTTIDYQTLYCPEKDKNYSIEYSQIEDTEFCPSCGESLTCKHEFVFDLGSCYNRRGERMDIKICEDCWGRI